MDDEVFDHGLVIAGDNGSIYHIKPEQLQSFKVNIARENEEGAKKNPKESWDLVERLLATGVSVAIVPKTIPPGPDPRPCGTCYVVNLASFAKPTKYWLPPSKQ